MDSFALAYIPTKKDKDYDFSIKVNINLWTQCGWKNDEPVLDIGFFISKLSAAQTIRLYVPFVVDTSNLEDLCECLSKDASLLGAVFNEPYTSADIPNQNKKARVFEGDDSKVKFILYKLDFSSQNDVRLNSYRNGETQGTFLDFDAKNILGSIKEGDCQDYYLRFRIQSPELRKCVREYEAPNRYFETLVNSTYMVDMRFNNTRSMNRSLVQTLTTQNNCALAPINGLHFLLMTKVDVDVSNDFNSSRVLEKKTWDEYVNLKGEGRTTEDIVAYHCSKKYDSKTISEGEKVLKDIGSWEFFTRLKAGRCSVRTIFPYILLLILFNVASNFVFNIIFSFLPQGENGRVDYFPQIIALLIIAFICCVILVKKKSCSIARILRKMKKHIDKSC